MVRKVRKNKDITIGKKRFPNWKAPEVQERALNKYHWMVQYANKFTLGKYTDIGAFTYINARNGVVLENGVQVGSHCSIYSYSTIDGLEGKVVLKENCKIGSHSVIAPGVTVGKNSIVGAFSFVKTDIPANVVAFGIPAKVIRKLKKEEIS
ncbi:MAG: acetyltransferase [Candidatus Wildermuthbacteria bacterium RIFCSPLOWO2_01_FULL_47_18]|uniref:Acetyltransferase n=2 Tax=Candidatus Wildermuthiibacteriota TaxID=1817923 RepID=A0A1G2RIB3_9BACT|nr:MAG: acetyltransferase [Candidatus Wildermuthbacteria bacterium RIFCSPHIGHO2_02_FULL_48_16]OHA72089.1 MAG: acetyltransferase [Candidatus Wildermuthbacteria bacterium RIFCSPLOWO2_01_FULL_47_18]